MSTKKQIQPPSLWTVNYSNNAKSQYDRLKRSGKRPSINDIINLLVIEMVAEGPYRINWANYGPLEEGKFHCHLKKGKPTYVACWEIIDKEKKIIEVYYVGSHENAPY
jgi:hypothetical protein